MQVVGNRLRDHRVISASAAIEKAIPWEEAYPPEAIEGDR
jgi:Asp-tRNA(Asn)/Glu-tRNA(Gln) amidotransferase A subunit family amidase